MACDTCGRRLSDKQIASYAAQLDTDPEWQTIMTAVAIAESGGCTSCYNGTCCTGLWQVHTVHAGKLGSPKERSAFIQWLRNPVNNTRVATEIYKSQGPSAWEAYTNQSYRDYIERARKVTGVSGPSLAEQIAGGAGAALGSVGGLNPLSQVTELLGTLVRYVGSAAAWFGDPHNWQRAILVVGGVTLGIVTVGIALSNNVVDRLPVQPKGLR